MNLYKFKTDEKTAEFIRNLHPQIKRKIKAGLKIIATDPKEGKSLKDELQGLMSFRVSRFRIIYRVKSGHVIEIITIGPRRTIYEETYLLLNK